MNEPQSSAASLNQIISKMRKTSYQVPQSMPSLLLFGSCLVLLGAIGGTHAGGDKGEDIIMAKGKIIMRGGKGKGTYQSGE